MEIIKSNPPNYAILKQIFSLRESNLYPFNPILYNPSGQIIPEDILFHESIHFKQQGNNPEKWWNKYIQDKDFRLKQELEAYSAQLTLIKKIYPAKLSKQALEEMAENLSNLYKLGITYHQASTLIRKYANK